MRWVHDSIWMNPNNWNLDRLPCSKDTISFPSLESTPVVVFLQKNVSVTEIHLPFHGEIVFIDNSGITATQPNSIDSNCAVGGEIQFKTRERGWWLDEANWCELSRAEGVECMTRRRFRLDTERVPCRNDEVVFTKFSSLLVQVEPNIELNIGVMNMFTGPVAANVFISLVKNTEQFFLPTTTTINIIGQTCNENAGCECGNNVGKIKEYICRRKTCPENLPCSNMFIPEGHCCSVCGVLTTFAMDTSCFSDRVFHYTIQDLLEHISVTYNKVVNVSVSRISNNRLQVAVIDQSSVGEGIRIGNELKTILERALQDKAKFCLTFLNHVSSISSYSAKVDAHTGETDQGKVGLGVSLFIIIVLLIIIIGLAFNMRHRISRQYIPRIRDRITNLVTSHGTTLEMDRRSIVFDNSAIFDSSLVATTDPTFVGFPRSETSLGTTEPSARLVDHDILSGEPSGGSGEGGGNMFSEAGRKIKTTFESISPRMILTNLEKRLSGESSDFFHSRLNTRGSEGLTETPGHDFDFNNPVYSKSQSVHQQSEQQQQASEPRERRTMNQKRRKADTEDTNMAFENPFFDEGKLKGTSFS